MTDEEIAENCRQIVRELSPWIERPEPNERKTLELFCNVVDELETYPLYQKLLKDGQVTAKIRICYGEVAHAEIQNLDEHDVRAFLLSARLFGQKNDRISIQKIAEIFGRRVSERRLLWMNFNGYRSGWNTLRDVQAPELPHTMGEIFDTFLYGHYAHRNEAKERVYQEWKQDRDGFVVRQTIFVIALGNFFWTVRGMRDCVRELLLVDNDSHVTR